MIRVRNSRMKSTVRYVRADDYAPIEKRQRHTVFLL
jgi:hypothetical protein